MSTQFSEEDHIVVGEFMALLVNLGMSPTEAYKNVDAMLQKQGWSFVFFNDLQDFWIMDNEMK